KKVQVIKGLEDVTVCEKDACTLEVTLSHAYIHGVWARNGVQLKAKPTCRIAAQGRRHTLTLTRASLSDMGRISFQAEGVETSATLIVTARDIEIVKHLEDVSVTEQETVTLVCEVNLEDMDGKWFKNDIRIKDKDNIKIKRECTTHSLMFKAIKPEDAGEIKFTAERVSSSAVLRVKAFKTQEHVAALPVQFVKPLRVKTVLYKHRALLECQVSRANAKVTWYKRGRKILPTGRFRLVSEGVYQQLIIDEVGSSDEDVFVCDAGENKTSCQLFVEEQAISIVRALSSVEVMEPKEACFRVETNLRAERMPRWTLNRELLSSSPEVIIESNGTSHRLKFTNTNSSMSGIVQFSFGKSRSTAQLTVTEHPLVVTQPISDVVVKEDGSATLSCGFCPSPRVVRWFKGRTPLLASSKYSMEQDMNRAEMTIMGVKATDSGQYRCLAGGAESRGQVNVEVERLKITRHLEQVEVEEEGTALFCCELNHEVTSVQWLLNDRVIHASHTNKIQNAGKIYSLFLKRLTPQVSRVTFRTVGLSETALLRVKERPAVFLRSLEDVVAEEHGKVYLRCEVSKQAVTPVWKKNGIVLIASDKHEILKLGKSLALIVHELRKDDAGKYTCDVETSQTKAKVIVHDLRVTIVRRLRTVAVLEGENCHFECVLSHDIIHEASWTLSGQSIVSNDRVRVAKEGRRYTLQIYEVMACDAGDVVFSVSDLSCRTMLFVKEKPVMIFRDMLNATATTGEDAELSCEVTKPEVTTRWLRNGRLIRVSPKYEMSQKGHLVKLTIHNATVRDSGVYCCEADGLATRARLEVRDFQHTFARELKAMQAEEKSTLVLECETKAPVGRVFWLKGTTVLGPGEKYLMRKKGLIFSLTIFNLKKSDSDLYTCDIGTVQSRAFLAVRGKRKMHGVNKGMGKIKSDIYSGKNSPVNSVEIRLLLLRHIGQKVIILDELEDAECLEGESVTFKCHICPSDFTEVRWYLDETLLYTNDLNEIKMTPCGHHTLTIRQLACKDTGTISFEAGDKRSYASLLVRERRPTITKALEDTEAIEGGSLVLLCRTSKPCHILWYKDSCLVWTSSRCQMSRFGTEAQLSIREVTWTDAGVYSCDAGSVRTTATVTVKAIPAEFTKHLQSLEAVEGSSVTLSCEFSVPGVQHVWRRGPDTLRSGEKYLMKQKNNYISLTIHSVKLEDSGTYTCICRNQRTMANITIHAFPITFMKQLKDQESEEGRTVTLRCELSKTGAPVLWLREQEALSSGRKYHIRQIVTIQELVIRNPVPGDSGLYSCVCTDQRTQATVTIKAQPITFTQKLKTQMAEEGTSVTLRCELSKPGLPVEWRKGMELLRCRGRYQIQQRGPVLEMKILHLRCEDSDVYSCTCGTAQTSARVTVSWQLISFKEKLKNQVAEEGRAVTLHCELSRSGAAVEWWKGEKLLQPGQKYQLRERDASHELVITDTVPEDSGVYTCVCEGQKSKATIRIAGVATTFKQNLKNQEAPEGGSVVLRCELSKSSVPVQWWKGEQCLMPGGRYRMRQDSNVAEMEITDVLPDHAGMYSCVTANQKSSAELKIRALPATFQRELVDQVSREGDSAVFTCELSKPGAPVEWRKGRIFLKAGAKYKMKLEGRLTKLVINDIEEGDSGKYTCKTKDAQSTAELVVQALPAFFKKPLTNQEVQEGNSLSLHCELTKPGAYLYWWRAGEVLKTGEKYQLRQRGLAAELLIRRAEAEDSGVYRCVCGEHSTEASIKVNVLPITFKQELKNQEAVEGSNITLCCELSKAGAQVQWWKGEELLGYGEKHQVRQMGTKVEFVIRNAVPEDSGVYVCACQHQRSKATITINALPPTFKQNLRNQVAAEGSHVTLRCELSKPGASVSWWKGQDLLTLGEKYHMKTEGRISEMIIRNVETEDSGLYSCTVGHQKTTSEIRVQALPVTFKQELQNEVANVGGSASFCCELSKPAAPVYWRKGRVILKAGDKYEMKQEGNITKLIIDNVEKTDAGTYSCKTKDSESNAELFVRVPPIVFTVKLKDQEVDEESTVRLHCELSRADVSVQWRKGDELLTRGSKYQIMQRDATMELIIKNAMVKDSGVYSCICGAQKNSATLKVSATPVTFRQTLKNQEAPEGGTVVLHCKLSKPGAPVQWLKEEEGLNNGAKYVMKQEGSLAELYIKNVLPMDVGKYSCVTGDQVTTAEVNVKAAPSAFFEKGLQNLEALEGTNVVFSCLLSSSNVPVTWKKDSKPIKEGGRFVFHQEGATQELEIRRLKAEDAGVYTCSTRGKKTHAALLVREHVRIERELQDVTVTAGEDAHFVCELSHEDISHGVWWLGPNILQENEMNQMSCHGREHHLVLTMTTPEESSVVAFVVGGERTEAHLQVNYKPKVLIEEKLQDVVIFEGDTATLLCVTSDTCTPVTWKRNNITLLPGEKYELRKEGKRNLLLIHRVVEEDAGVYMCDTRDMQSLAALTIKARPLFFCEELQNQQAEEGESAFLFCKLSRPGAAVQWKKGAVLLKHGQKCEMTQNGCELQLQIHDLMIQDSGVYTCCADGIESTASLDVNEQPLFFCKELESVEVEEGETTFLSCELSKARASVHWKKGTMLLRPGNKYEMKQYGCELELQIRDLTYQDTGIYKCCAGGILETEAKILVKEHELHFREHLQSQQVMEGDTVFLSCMLSKPGVAVQWKKGTVLLKPGDKYQMKRDGCKLQLKIHDLKAQDSGTYKCCTGSLVTTASIMLQLTDWDHLISEQPLFFQKELKSVEADEGETALLCCELSKPGVLVQWKKDTVLLKPADKFEMTLDGCKFQLLVHDLTSQDNGIYSCCAGSLVTTSTLHVKEQSLFFHKELQSEKAGQGETARMCCELSKPGVAVQWKKESQLLKPGDKYQMKQEDCKQQLGIRHLKHEDSGTYRCRGGGLVTTACLEVKGQALFFSEALQSLEAEEGEIALVCCELSKPGVLAEWKKEQYYCKQDTKVSTKPKTIPLDPAGSCGNCSLQSPVGGGQSNAFGPKKPTVGQQSSLDTISEKPNHDHLDHVKSTEKQNLKNKSVMRQKKDEDEKPKMTLDVNKPTHSEEEFKISFPVDQVPADEHNRGTDISALNITESSTNQSQEMIIDQVERSSPGRDTTERKSETQNKSIALELPRCKIKYTQPNVGNQGQHGVLEPKKQVVVVEPSVETTSIDFSATLGSEQLDLNKKRTEEKDASRETSLKQQLKDEKPGVHDKIHSEPEKAPLSGGVEKTIPKHVEKKAMIGTTADQKCRKQPVTVREVPEMSSEQSSQQMAVQTGQNVLYTGITEETDRKQEIQIERMPETQQPQDQITEKARVNDPGMDIEENTIENTIDQKYTKEHIIARKLPEESFKQFPQQKVEQLRQNIPCICFTQQENRKLVNEMEKVPVLLTTQPQAGTAQGSKVGDAGMEINDQKTMRQINQTKEVTESLKHTNVPEVILPEHPRDSTFIEKSTEEEAEMLETAVKIQTAFRRYQSQKDMRPVFKVVFKNQNVELSDTVCLECVTEGKASTVRWLKDGVDMKSGTRHNINYTEDGRCTLVISNVILKDSGIYTCEVSNKFGVVSYNGNVMVGQIKKPVSEVLQRPATEPVLEKEPVQASHTEGPTLMLVCCQPAGVTHHKIQEKRKCLVSVGSESCPSDYDTAPEAETGYLSLEKDMGKRSEACRSTCHELLRTTATSKEKGNETARKTSSHKYPHSSGNMESLSNSDGDEDTVETFDIYVATVDSPPTDKDPFILKAGQFVEVLDSVHAVKWLVRTKPTKTTPSRQGWICPAYLEKKTKVTPVVASLSHVSFSLFFSEVIKCLLDSENEFVRDMNFVEHSLQYECTSKVPLTPVSQREHMFHSMKTIISFHKNCFLPKLKECVTDDDVAQCFVSYAPDFTMYVQYISDTNTQHFCEASTWCCLIIPQTLEPEVCSISACLQRPLTRIQTYKTLLKELIRNKAQTGQSCRLLEDAFSMVCSLHCRVENLQHVSRIESYPAPVGGLGELVRQGAFTVWEEAPGTKVSLRGHRRRVFLFKDCVVFCKPKRDVNTRHEVYVFKNKMKLSDLKLKEPAEGDDRSWGLWHEHRGTVRQVTLRARTVAVRLAWFRELQDLQQQCIQHPLWSSPCFELILRDFAAKLGQTIKLACKVIGTPKPVIAWYKDGIAVKEDQCHALSVGDSGVCCLLLASVTAEDSGQYVCYAASPMGNASTLAKLTVDVPPYFTTKLANAVLVRGQDSRFQCSTACFPVPTVRWFKDSGHLRNSQKYEIHSDVQTGVLILDIKKAEETDLGQYECELLNQMGSAKCKAHLYATPPSVTDSPSDQSQLASAPEPQSDAWSGTLVQNLSHLFFLSGPSTAYSQTGDTQEVEETQPSSPFEKTPAVSETRENENSAAAFVLTNACRQAEQQVFSRNSHTCGKSNSLITKRVSSVPPVVQVTMEDVHVRPGQPASLSALITGQPVPEVTWYKDGVALPAGEQIRRGLCYSLTLQGVGIADCGTYTCTATNSSGHASCHAQLTVDAGPEEFEGVEDKRVVEVGGRRKLHSVYSVHEEIGRGTFGVVKRLSHRRSGEVFAAKFVPLRSGTQAYQERDLLSRLSHPGLACLLDVFCTSHTLVLVTEICSSQGLLDHLFLKSSVTERQVQVYIQQVLDGIKYIHSVNVLHLDIKTDNILMVSPEREEVKICDFGFSQEIDPSRHQYSVFGTPEFVAPEIVHREPVTATTDIWCLDFSVFDSV
ncbi:hypothetical protein P4O66_022686, partial [Electrophorus voltai]